MKRKEIEKLLFICVAFALTLILLYSGLRVLEVTVLRSSGEEAFRVETKTVVKDGVSYFPRQDITVVLVLGVDQEGPVQASPTPNHGNAVDMVTVMVFDETAKHCTLLNLNRDIMLDMPMLNDYGREDGSYFGQLAYSHTYGTGVEDSCENTRKAVSRFLNGITIDYYLAMNMGAVPLLNDAVGGVTVEVVHDFSKVDASLPMGTVTLQGQQALTFVQTRWDVGDELNLSRIDRQMVYMDSFMEKLRSCIKADKDFAVDIYDTISPYVVTDLSLNTLSGMAQRYQEYPVKAVLSIEGENVLGETYYEFYPDEEALETLILDLFYAPKK